MQDCEIIQARSGIVTIPEAGCPPKRDFCRDEPGRKSPRFEEKEVEFYDDTIVAILVHPPESQQPQIYVPLRPICQHLGIAWRAQNLRLKRNPVLSEVLRAGIVTIPDVGKREMLCLPLDYLNGFVRLFTRTLIAA